MKIHVECVTLDNKSIVSKQDSSSSSPLNISFDFGQHQINVLNVYKFISSSSYIYPNFQKWFLHKVVTGVFDGSRSIVVLLVKGQIAGVSVLKNTYSEKKICNLKIAPSFRSFGLGTYLFEKSFYELNTGKPLASVSEYKYLEFKPILNFYGFEFDGTSDIYQRKDSLELVFNGTLTEDSPTLLLPNKNDTIQMSRFL